MLRQLSLKPIYSTVPLLCLFLCMFLCLSLLPTNSEAATKSTRYAIVVSSLPGTKLKWETKKHPLFTGRTFYVEQTTVKGKAWERLCLGYFDSHNQAASMQKKILKIYPGAWIIKASEKSIKSTISSTAKKSSASKPPAKAKPPALPEKQSSSLMQRAKIDFRNQNYSSAIRYLTALVAADNHKDSQEALELLGIARQRNGQNAHAVDIYEKYLKLYPEADGANRVRQRLAGLLTATSKPRKKIHLTTEAKAINDVSTYGSLSQSYLNNRAIIDGIGDVTTVSQLITYLDVTTLQRSNKFDHRYQFTADHIYDFIDDKDESEFRFRETYYELSYRKTGSSGRFGRQLLRIGGIRKRFDGLSAGYQINPDMRLNILGGFPVDNIDNKSSINKEKTFYGITFETGTFLKHWDMNLFYFDQKVDGLNDGTSAGTELRYRDKTKSLFGLVNYDTFYKEVNVLQLNTNIQLNKGRSAYLNAYMRKTPILATSNALIGRPEETIEELKKTLNVEQIYQLARDRTANSQTITVGGIQPINKRFQTSADITLYQVDSTVASGGVLATEDTGTDYYLSTQLVGNSLFLKGDTGVLGLRYNHTEPSNTLSFIVNSRFSVSKKWRINPRLQYDIRKLNDAPSQDRIRAMLRTDYRYLNKVRFDFEIGYDASTQYISGQSFDNNNLFFTLGYRWDF